MTSQLTTLVPVLQGPHNYHEWAPRMQSYLMAQGYWRTMNKPRPPTVVLQSTTEERPKASTSKSILLEDEGETEEIVTTNADEVTAAEEKLEKWEDNNDKAKGAITLRLSSAIAFQHQSLTTALGIWVSLSETYGQPGPIGAYIELKKALDVRIPSNADPSPAYDRIVTHFGRLSEMGYEIPANIQAILVMARLPAELDSIAQAACMEGSTSKLDIAHIRRALTVYWEQKNGKKSQQGGQQKANKISAVKRDQGQPAFSEQQDRGEESSRGGRGQGRGRGRRGKRGGQKQANQAEEDKERSRSRPSSSMGMLASSIFMPPPPSPAPPVFPPPPPSSIYPSFNSALSIARHLDVQPTIETLKRLEAPELTRDPRLTKKRRLEERLSKPIDDEVVSLGSSEDEMDLDDVLAISAVLEPPQRRGPAAKGFVEMPRIPPKRQQGSDKGWSRGRRDREWRSRE